MPHVFHQLRQLATRRAGGLQVVIAVAWLSGCTAVNIEWSEEVRLADAKSIVVDRTATGEKKREIGGPGGWMPSQMSLYVSDYPPGMRPPPEWRDAFVPILLDYQPANETWSLVVTFYFCSRWYELGKPELPYLEYQSRGGGDWMKIPLEQRLIGRDSNLLTGPSANGEPRLLTIRDKVERERNASDRFKVIVSEWSGC